MPIQVACPNGHKMTAKDKLAGKKVRCPKCQVPFVLTPSASSPISTSTPEFAAPEPNTAAPFDADLPVDPSLPEFGNADAGVGEGLPDFDVLSDIPAPYVPAPAPSPAADTQPAGQEPESNLWLKVGVGSAGAVVILVFLVGGWFLLPGDGADAPPPIASAESGNDESLASVDEASIGSSGTPPASKTSAPLVSGQTEALPTAAPDVRTKMNIPEAAQPSKPHSLTIFEGNPKLTGGLLPQKTWASAYAPETGLLAVTNDEAKAVVLYGIDDTLSGRPEALAVLPTPGLPTSVCLKPFNDKRMWVVGGQDSPSIQFYDADNLTPTKKIRIKDCGYPLSLACSSNPDDPYVYFITHATPTDRYDPDFQELKQSAFRLGRINLQTQEQGTISRATFRFIRVSPDGSQLFAKTVNGHGFVGNWEQVVISSQLERFEPKAVRKLDFPDVRFYGNDRLARSVWNNTMEIERYQAGFEPLGGFVDRCVAVGVHKEELVVCSGNNYERFDGAAFPNAWLDAPPSTRADFRYRHNRSLHFKSPILDTYADSDRAMFILVLQDKILALPLSQFNIPQEPKLEPLNASAHDIFVGEELNVPFEFESGSEGIRVEYIDNATWLPDESTKLLGVAPPGHELERPLQLKRAIGFDDDEVRLKDYSKLRGLKFPCRLRIGNEFMTATNLRFQGLEQVLDVERTARKRHSNERVAFYDAKGRDITTPKYTAPPGKVFYLEAEIDKDQVHLFIQRTDIFKNVALPCRIQLGPELMRVDSVDNFDRSLHVRRTKSMWHSVSTPGYLLPASGSEPLPLNLPRVEDNRLVWSPREDQVGSHNIRLRVTSGTFSREVFWKLKVSMRDGKR